MIKKSKSQKLTKIIKNSMPQVVLIPLWYDFKHKYKMVI